MKPTAHRLLLTALHNLPFIAILRGLQPTEAAAVGQALAAADWGLIEVPLNSPQPLVSIERLTATLPQALVGAGTVLSANQVRDVHAAGGRLVVSPNFNPEVVRCALSLDMACLPGVMTPTEAFAAVQAGAHGLKLFPAEMITPGTVKAWRTVLPAETLLLPVGGIALNNLDAYLQAGANGFGIGSALYQPGMTPAAAATNAITFTAYWRKRSTN
jgi:2-dehydro-3-deoxyphosphogalactonate aldolase